MIFYIAGTALVVAAVAFVGFALFVVNVMSDDCERHSEKDGGLL